MARTFGAETELREDVVSWLAGVPGCDVIVDEVEGLQGIPDLVGGRAKPDVLSSRLGQAHLPVCRPWEVCVMRALEGHTLEADVRRALPGPWQRWKKDQIRELQLAGWVAHDCDDIPGDHPGRRWWIAADFEDPFRRVMAVNLKVRFGRSGVLQAFRCTHYVDASYLALPAEAVTRTAKSEVAPLGVGLLAVGKSGAEVVVEPVHGRLWDHQTRRLIAERMLMALRYPQYATRRAGTPGGVGKRCWTVLRQQERLLGSSSPAAVPVATTGS
jgi:hypothetical protein